MNIQRLFNQIVSSTFNSQRTKQTHTETETEKRTSHFQGDPSFFSLSVLDLFETKMKIWMMMFLFMMELNECDGNIGDRKEYFIETCCTMNESETMEISCEKSESISMNLIEIFYNSNKNCLSNGNCCLEKTKCSRRLTKYFKLNCDGKSHCFISRYCSMINHPCAHIHGYHGQYLLIHYSCFKSSPSSPSLPSHSFILKSLKIPSNHSDHHHHHSEHFSSSSSMNEEKSLKTFLILILLVLSSFLLIYSTFYFIGKSLCHPSSHFSLTNSFSLPFTSDKSFI